MNEAVINFEQISKDLRTISCKVRAFRGKLQKTFKEEDLKTRLSKMFDTEGYEYELNYDGSIFKISVNQAISIVGSLEKRVYKIGFDFEYNGVHVSSYIAGCGFVEIDIERLELYGPVFNNMIEQGLWLTSRYDELMKSQKGLELFDTVLANYFEQHSVSGVTVKAIDAKEGKYIIKKSLFGVLVYAEIEYANYLEVCDRFINALKRFPGNFPQNTSIFLSEYSDRPRKKYINVRKLPEDFKMIYAKKEEAVANPGNSKYLISSEIQDTLDKLGYIYSFNNATDTLDVVLNKNLWICRTGDETHFECIEPGRPRCKRTNLGKTTDIDESAFVILLRMMAMASQNGGIKLSYKDIYSGYERLFTDSVQSIIAKIVEALLPQKYYLGAHLGIHVNSFCGLRFDGKLSENIRNLLTFVHNPELLKFTDMWEKEPEDSCVNMIMERVDFFDLKKYIKTFAMRIWGKVVYHTSEL